MDVASIQSAVATAMVRWADEQPLSVELWSGDGYPLHMNAAWHRLWQLNSHDILAKQPCLLADPIVRAKPLWTALQAAFEHGRAGQMPENFYDPEAEHGMPGKAHWTEGHIAPIWTGYEEIDSHGPQAVAIILHDVSAVRRRRTQLREISEAMQNNMREHLQSSATMTRRSAKPRVMRAASSAKSRSVHVADAEKDPVNLPEPRFIEGSPTPLMPLRSALAIATNVRDFVHHRAPRVRVSAPAEQRIAAAPEITLARLAAAEVDVLHVLALGATPREIAEVLGKSEKTIYSQCRSMMKRLNLENLNQLVVYACHWTKSHAD